MLFIKLKSICISIFCILLYLIIFFTIYSIFFIERLNLNKIDDNNKFYLYGRIEKKLIDNAIQKFRDIPIYNNNKNFYFIIDSNGGDFDQGDLLIKIMKIKKNIEKINFICIVRNAASMAFYITQYCDERYVLLNSMMMSHPIKISFTGDTSQIELWYKTDFIQTKNKEKKMIQDISIRINMEINEYKNKIKNDWYIYGGITILLENLADKLIFLIE